MRKANFKQALKTWRDKGYQDGVFGIERYVPPSAVEAERQAYGEGYILGMEERERKEKARKEMETTS